MRVNVACFSLPVASPSFCAVSRVPCAGRLVPLRPPCVHVRSPPPILVSSRGRAQKSQRRREQTRCSNACCFGCAALRSCFLREASVAFRACAWRRFIVTFVRSRCWQFGPFVCGATLLRALLPCCPLREPCVEGKRAACLAQGDVFQCFCALCQLVQAACCCVRLVAGADGCCYFLQCFECLGDVFLRRPARKCSAILPGGVELDVLSVVSFGDLPHASPCRGHVGVARAGAVEHRVRGVLPSEKRAVRLRCARVCNNCARVARAVDKCQRCCMCFQLRFKLRGVHFLGVGGEACFQLCLPVAGQC
ncbi:hypothetical protein, conserved in T. vivax [Trypanosoma vivax Y486]|uniref:Uncharacterized protein n=1 Tax=Trypanosoma vivax (strain Y486) TaxID=1055687 RepID=F9WU15_TRYVY|nr:hypothetical protein, conserved in T. vivax [Trypanosoma vivax Y486]|eukprot:CCD21061.1 hypothetical protein, conserved in T. vivax [Trypanosoma vivax Y486]